MASYYGGYDPSAQRAALANSLARAQMQNRRPLEMRPAIPYDPEMMGGYSGQIEGHSAGPQVASLIGNLAKSITPQILARREAQRKQDAVKNWGNILMGSQHAPGPYAQQERQALVNVVEEPNAMGPRAVSGMVPVGPEPYRELSGDERVQEIIRAGINSPYPENVARSVQLQEKQLFEAQDAGDLITLYPVEGGGKPIGFQSNDPVALAMIRSGDFTTTDTRQEADTFWRKTSEGEIEHTDAIKFSPEWHALVDSETWTHGKPQRPLVGDITVGAGAGSQDTHPRVTKMMNEVDERGGAAVNIIPTLENLRTLLTGDNAVPMFGDRLESMTEGQEKAYFATGPGANWRQWGRGVMYALGMADEKTLQSMYAYESFRAWANEVVLPRVKMLGARPTDRDLQFIVDASPSLTNTTRGNLLIIEALLLKAEREKAEAQRLSDFFDLTSDPTSDLYDVNMQKYVQSARKKDGVWGPKDIAIERGEYDNWSYTNMARISGLWKQYNEAMGKIWVEENQAERIAAMQREIAAVHTPLDDMDKRLIDDGLVNPNQGTK